MATISNIELTVTTDRPHNRARIVVNCAVEFIEFEVNAMNQLELTYELSCRILDKHPSNDNPAAGFPTQMFPRTPGAASRMEHAEFELVAPMTDIRERVFGKDKLVAELTLKNDAFAPAFVKRSDVLAVDLAASEHAAHEPPREHEQIWSTARHPAVP